jgi:hypothetical protein
MAGVFLFATFVSMLHPLVWAGYCIAGLASPRLPWALLAAVVWALIVTLVFAIPMPAGPLGASLVELLIYRVLAAVIVAAVMFFVRRGVVRLLRKA